MKHLRKLGLLLSVLSVAVVGCGGGGGGDDVDSGLSIVDGGRDSGRVIDSSVAIDSTVMMSCNAVTNAGCTAPMKCSVGPADALVCQPAGAGMQGAACGTGTTDDGCAIGFVCLMATGGMKCHRFCDPAAAQCPMDGTMPTACNTQITNAAMQPIAGATVCDTFATCDIFAQTGCTAGTQGCYIAQAGQVCGTAGTIAENGACGAAAGNCMPGMLCVGPAAGQQTCKKVCRVGGTPACTTGTCMAINFGGAMNVPANLGACL